MMTEFDVYEKTAIDHGAMVQRRPDAPAHGLGTRWDVRVELGGKQRDIALQVCQFEGPKMVGVNIDSSKIVGEIQCALVELSPMSTRLSVSVELRPLTLPARLLIQSLKLTKPKLDIKIQKRVAELVADFQEKYRSQA